MSITSNLHIRCQIFEVFLKIHSNALPTNHKPPSNPFLNQIYVLICTFSQSCPNKEIVSRPPNFQNVVKVASNELSMSSVPILAKNIFAFFLIASNGHLPHFCPTFNTASPRFSPRGLIVNFKIWHGGLFQGWLIRGERAYQKFCTLHGGLFEKACFLRAIIILG